MQNEWLQPSPLTTLTGLQAPINIGFVDHSSCNWSGFGGGHYFAYLVDSGSCIGRRIFQSVKEIMTSWFGLVVLLGFSWAIFYHLCNGIRHLFWDAGYGFDLDTAYRSGWATVAGSFLLTGVAWAIGLLS